MWKISLQHNSFCWNFEIQFIQNIENSFVCFGLSVVHLLSSEALHNGMHPFLADVTFLDSYLCFGKENTIHEYNSPGNAGLSCVHKHKYVLPSVVVNW